jgi:glycosyltransferase involved in cell wall biosynthesis
MTLRFSIIVPTLDRREMLQTALASIRAQAWPDTEIIVVDGGSSDGTVEEMVKHSNICLLKGPDKGVYDAFNKGIARATGDIIGVLNSDDLYEPGAFSAVAAAFAADPNAAAVCGTAILFEEERILAEFNRDSDKALSSPRVSLIGSCVPNARFFRRSAMAKAGPFSLEYQYVSDRDWLTRWYELGLKTVSIPQRVYRYRQHRGSLTFRALRPNELAIRSELLELARRWRDDATASRETRRCAILLEGRCIATFVLLSLRDRQLADALRWIFVDNGRWSIAPIGALLRSVIDLIPGSIRFLE